MYAKLHVLILPMCNYGILKKWSAPHEFEVENSTTWNICDWSQSMVLLQSLFKTLSDGLTANLNKLKPMIWIEAVMGIIIISMYIRIILYVCNYRNGVLHRLYIYIHTYVYIILYSIFIISISHASMSALLLNIITWLYQSIDSNHSIIYE